MSHKQVADVSVVIPAYRAARTLTRTLLSIANQSLAPREVIVVDDGSDDGTAGVAESCRSSMNGIKLTVVVQVNGGAGSARNRAIAIATGEWLAFLDADDEWLSDKLERTFVAIAESGEELVLLSHDVIVCGKERETVFNCAIHDVGAADPFHAMYRRGYVSTSTALARRDAVVRAGGFDVTLPNAQDFDLWLALLAEPQAKMLVFPGAHTRHYNQAGSIQTHTKRRLQCSMVIAERYIDVLKRRPGSALLSLVFRGLAIHAEALVVYRDNGHLREILKSIAIIPLRLMGLLMHIFRPRHHRRQSYIPDST